MLHNLHPTPIKMTIFPEQITVSSKKNSTQDKLRLDTQPSFDQFKSASKLNPQRSSLVVFEPSSFQKLLMLPFPFLMIGCCTSKTSVLQFNCEKKILSITSYPGFFKCCKKEYEIHFQDIIGTKLMVAFNHRINKRQAYRIYLETSIGDFELTVPKNREESLKSKSMLDDMLKLNEVWNV